MRRRCACWRFLVCWIGGWWGCILRWWGGWGGGRRRAGEGEKDYFLGGRSLPTWAVAVSLVATMLSTATFVGVPDLAYGGNLTYLMLNAGGIVAVLVVAWVFVPRLYAAGTVTIYGFLAQRFGEGARLAVSCTFILGRMLASGARLFLAAIPLCLLMFGPGVPTLGEYVLAIGLIGVVGTFSATGGGVRAVVWVDVIQFCIVVGTAALTIGLLLHRIPLSVGEIIELLRHAEVKNGGSKLTVVDWSRDPSKAFTVWAAVFGNSFLLIAAYGTDQDLAQRFLITKSAARGGISVIASQLIGMAVVSLFLGIGLLLYVFYDRPEVMGAVHQVAADRKSVYPWFLMHELPTGLAGLSMAGLFAVAQGSLDSAMNALGSSVVADVWEPWRKTRNAKRKTLNLGEETGDGSAGGHASKWVVAGVGAALCGFAIVCAAVYDRRTTLVDFALGVMTFALSGMLGVFLTALLTRRGNSASVVAALVVGVAAVAGMQDGVMGWWSPLVFGHGVKLAWPWWMPIATGLSFLVCVAPRGRGEGMQGVEERL
jgi:SSS family solute:Na+ symporter